MDPVPCEEIPIADCELMEQPLYGGIDRRFLAE
jgi:hypothetical protein